VARQGNATIWTAPRHVVQRVLEDAQKSHSSALLQFPRVTADSGAPAHFSSRANRELITQVAWQDDGEPQTAPERVRVGWVGTIVGRKLDQGILVQLVFEDTAINAIHRVNLSRACEAESACTAASAAKSGDVLRCPPDRCVDIYGDVFVNRPVPERAVAGEGEGAKAAARSADACTTAAAVAVEVPEISKQEVVGEWLIPRGESLLVSFGVHTVAGKDGKAVVKERLATLDAEELTGASAVQKASAAATYYPVPKPVAPSAVRLFERLALPPAPRGDALKIPMPMPVVPSRTIPQGIHADGTKAELPPLPPDEAQEPASESSEPLPSPQKKKPQAQPRAPSDSATDKAALAPPRPATFPFPGLIFPTNPAAPANLQFLVPIKPLYLKLPFNQRLEIEILGRVVPNTEPAGKGCD